LKFAVTAQTGHDPQFPTKEKTGDKQLSSMEKWQNGGSASCFQFIEGFSPLGVDPD
jgi:hypothetical protein